MCSEGKIPVFSDKEDAENPMDREEVKESVKLSDLKSYKKILTEMAAGPLEGMTVIRVPVVEERPQPEDCFDVIIKALVEENPAKTQCIFCMSVLGKTDVESLECGNTYHTSCLEAYTAAKGKT